MRVGRVFPGGGATRRFFQNFSMGAKSGEICFCPLEIKKTTFFCWNFQNPGGPSPSSDAHGSIPNAFNTENNKRFGGATHTVLLG